MLIFLLIVRLIIINNLINDSLSFSFSFFDLFLFLIKYTDRFGLLLDFEIINFVELVDLFNFHKLLICIDVRVIVRLVAVHIDIERALHKGLILCSNSFRCSSDYNEGIVTDTYEKRAQYNGEIEAISCLPVKHIGGRW